VSQSARRDGCVSRLSRVVGWCRWCSLVRVHRWRRPVGCVNSVLPANRMFCDVRPNLGAHTLGATAQREAPEGSQSARGRMSSNSSGSLYEYATTWPRPQAFVIEPERRRRWLSRSSRKATGTTASSPRPSEVTLRPQLVDGADRGTNTARRRSSKRTCWLPAELEQVRVANTRSPVDSLQVARDLSAARVAADAQ